MTTVSPQELLKILRGYPFLAGYGLAFYSQQNGVTAKLGRIISPPPCGEECAADHENGARTAIAGNAPHIFRCRAGLIHFAVPFGAADSTRSCILGGGVREGGTELEAVEELALSRGIDPFQLLESMEKLPVSSRDGLSEVAERLRHILSSLESDSLHLNLLDKTMKRLDGIEAVSAQAENAETAAEAVSFLSETLGVLFDLPGIAVALPLHGGGFRLTGTWGLTGELGEVPEQKLRGMLPVAARSGALPDGAAGDLLPEAERRSLLCLPLAVGEELLGAVFMFDAELHPRDILQAEFLTGRVAGKLLRLRREEEHRQEKALTDRLMGAISSLALAEGKDELCMDILEMAADLLQASCGSLMLLDPCGEQLCIMAAKGMNAHLARTMSVKVGTEIAGRVAASGHPLLVNDIESDGRVGIPNRPRFKTKSFISIPLRQRERTIGVLNLSDKKNHGIFTEADLDLLTRFAGYACIMIERSESRERADMLERLSVTDPLTGLYNRRFLEKRMEEELSRCARHGGAFTLLLVDLDNFKTYNDLCGHLAGDTALRKVAKVLQASARQMDTATRYGGEEFCLILPNTAKKESIFVAERIRRKVEDEPFACEERLPKGRLTTSIGISSFPEDGVTAQTLLHAADTALYRAKDEGRNRVVLYEPGAQQPDTTARSAPSL